MTSHQALIENRKKNFLQKVSPSIIARRTALEQLSIDILKERKKKSNIPTGIPRGLTPAEYRKQYALRNRDRLRENNRLHYLKTHPKKQKWLEDGFTTKEEWYNRKRNAYARKRRGIIFGKIDSSLWINKEWYKDPRWLAYTQKERVKILTRYNIHMATTAYCKNPLTIFEELEIYAIATICSLCKKRLNDDWHSPLQKTMDHKIPGSLGGTHTRDNVWILCRLCNVKKGKKTEYSHLNV